MPLAVCNEGASHVQGRAAFFAQDDFAFVSDRGGRLAIWRCELQAQRVSQLTRPEAGASDYGPGAPGRHAGDYLFFRTEPGSKTPHVWSARVGQADGAVALGTQMGNQPWFVPGTNAFVFHSDRDGADAVYRQLRSLPPRQSGSARRTPARRTPRRFRRPTGSTSR